MVLVRKGVLRDPRSRCLAGIIAFVMAPGLVLGGGLWTASYAINRALVADQPPPCQPTPAKGPVQNSFVVNVLNATSQSGAAAAVAKELPLRDFTAGAVANDEQVRRTAGVGEVRFGSAGVDQALVAQKLLLPGAKLVKDYRDGTAVDLVLGPDFTGLQAPDGPLVRRTDVTVNVYNTTYFDGLATSTSAGLVGFGFVKGAVGLDPKNSWITEVAAVRHGPDGLAGAKLVQEAVPGSTLLADPAMKGTPVDLLIGMKWDKLAAADKLTPQSPKKPLGPVDIIKPCPKK